MSVQKVCGHCKVEFSVPNRRHETVKFCSRECKTEAGWVQYKCAKCGELFKRKGSDNANSETRFCSVACSAGARKGRKHKVKPGAPRYYKTCEVCNSQFRVTETRKDTARFCSKKCMSESPAFRILQSEVQQGEKHWRWDGGNRMDRGGYIRHKARVFGATQVTLNHRTVLQTALIEAEPHHPFLTVVDGEKRLKAEIEVHHIDRNRSNNVLSNLLAVTKYAHSQIHHRNIKPKPWECWPSDPEVW